MCNPLAIFVASSVLAVGTGYVQLQQQKAAAKVDEQVTAVNVKLSEQAAVDAERAGAADASERRMKLRQQLAEQTVGFAGQNVALSGTALDILGDTAMFGNIDEQRIRADAARKAWGYRMQGWNYQTQGKLNAYTAKANEKGTILTTAGNVLNAYGDFSAKNDSAIQAAAGAG